MTCDVVQCMKCALFVKCKMCDMRDMRDMRTMKCMKYDMK